MNNLDFICRYVIILDNHVFSMLTNGNDSISDLHSRCFYFAYQRVAEAAASTITAP